MAGTLEGRTVLIVDDDEDVLSSIDLAVRSEGGTTVLAADGHDAVLGYKASSPDVVVLDMMLPKRSGFLVLEEIKEADDAPIVIMVTANEGRRHMSYAQSLGVDAYLQKPVALQRLIDTIGDLLTQRE